MPADLRRHARYPETLFRVQAEIYRTYHMLDPQAFYNKEDMWDLARYTAAQEGQSESVTPTYVVASLPDQNQAEFLLSLPFTPRNKDNLIGLMLARCDGAHLGEIVVLQLSKQELIFGPAQIAARINQEQTISKDLTLWNQQGSHVLRSQILVLPVDSTFLYVDSIYIQSASTSMPQLKKIVLAVGNRLIYTDTYEQAIAQLSPGAQTLIQQAEGPAWKPGAPAAATPSTADQRLERVRAHLRRYRDLAAQGKWADAGKEIRAIPGRSQAVELAAGSAASVLIYKIFHFPANSRRFNGRIRLFAQIKLPRKPVVVYTKIHFPVPPRSCSRNLRLSDF